MFQVSGIWADVMRPGIRGENTQHDTDWWIAYQKEIEFAFGVLSGLKLAIEVTSTDDGVVVYDPSFKMNNLYKKNRESYRQARDEHLKTVISKTSNMKLESSK